MVANLGNIKANKPKVKLVLPADEALAVERKAVEPTQVRVEPKPAEPAVKFSLDGDVKNPQRPTYSPETQKLNPAEVLDPFADDENFPPLVKAEPTKVKVEPNPIKISIAKTKTSTELPQEIDQEKLSWWQRNLNLAIDTVNIFVENTSAADLLKPSAEDYASGITVVTEAAKASIQAQPPIIVAKAVKNVVEKYKQVPIKEQPSHENQTQQSSSWLSFLDPVKNLFNNAVDTAVSYMPKTVQSYLGYSKEQNSGEALVQNTAANESSSGIFAGIANAVTWAADKLTEFSKLDLTNTSNYTNVDTATDSHGVPPESNLNDGSKLTPSVTNELEENPFDYNTFVLNSNERVIADTKISGIADSSAEILALLSDGQISPSQALKMLAQVGEMPAEIRQALNYLPKINMSVTMQILELAKAGSLDEMLLQLEKQKSIQTTQAKNPFVSRHLAAKVFEDNNNNGSNFVA